MLGVGVYLIYEGDIINKYQQEITRRNYYEEEMTELPAIVTTVNYRADNNNKTTGQFEKDYHLHFIEGEQFSLENATSLTYGANSVNGSKFDVQIENYRNNIGVAIMLTNLSSGMPSEYNLIYNPLATLKK